MVAPGLWAYFVIRNGALGRIRRRQYAIGLEATTPLRRMSCDDDGRHGWRALLTAGDEEAEDNDEVAVYCPQCAEREFGGQ